MPTPTDLSDIITDSLTDAALPLEEPDLETAVSDDLQHVEEPATTDTEATAAPETTSTESPAETAEVSSPATKSTDTAKADDFEKRFGIPANSATGRENRIPHSRVKQMVTKADKETEARIRAEYTPKVTEFETKVKDYETKVADYEGRLSQVAKFEEILAKDPVQFLTMLYGQPQYQAYLRPLFEAPAPQEQQAPTQQPSIEADMPQPDQTLADGSKVYSMEGLTKLNTWNRAQAAKEARETTLAEVDKKFGPIYNQWEQYQRVQSVLPKVQAQIAEARKWPQFNENEAAITDALKKDQGLSLEGAYRQVVLPVIQKAQETAQTDRGELEKQIRAQVLDEIKKTPRSTSAPSRSTQPGAPRVGSGPRSLESVIEEAVRGLK